MEKTIITISRQYGSGGREVGKKLSARLGVPYYDRELLELAAKESGIDVSLFQNSDEDATNAKSSLLYSLVTGSALIGHHMGGTGGLSYADKLFLYQAETIRKVADEGSCVIVGRCSDYVLRNHSECVNIYVHAPKQARMRRAIREYGLAEDSAEDDLRKIDKRRASYYEFYAGKTWGRADNYHLSLCSARLGVEGCVQVIEDYIKTLHAAQAADKASI